MADEKSGFFDAKLVGDAYDRVYNASSFANYFSSFIGNGVFAGKYNDLAVLPANTPDMTVRVLPGQAWINGYWYENSNDGDKVFTVQPAAGQYKNRYDAIVVRLDLNERKMSVELKQGAEAKTPVKQSPSRSGGIWELVLAYVLVEYGTSAITSELITDTRADNVLCGYAHGVVDQVSTTTIFNQLQAQTSKAVSDSQAAVNAAIQSLQAAQASAVSAMNSALDGTKVGEQDAKIADIAAKSKHLSDFTTLAGGTDLNNVTTLGNYFLASTNTYVNMPMSTAGSSCMLYVIEIGGAILQELTTIGKTSCVLYYRSYFSGSWGNWINQYSVGVTPIANGGTGSTSASGACNAIGAVSTSGYDSGGDLNNATVPGFYLYNNTDKNIPIASLGVVYVCRRGDYISQLAVNNLNGSNGGRIWVRSKTGTGAWTAWERIINDASAVAIYSLYNPYDKDHFLTPSVSEYNSLISAGWSGDGIKFYAITK